MVYMKYVTKILNIFLVLEYYANNVMLSFEVYLLIFSERKGGV